jgi:tetratricopeptide (TPR) repeat protein
MSPYSKKIYGMMMREIGIMGPYQISRICDRVGINQFLVTEKDLPYLAKELSRVVHAYRGAEHVKSFAVEFSKLYDIDALIFKESKIETKIDYLTDMGDLMRLVGEWDVAEKYYKKVISLSKDKAHPLQECRAHRKMGSMFAMKSELRLATLSMEEAQRMCKERQDKLEMAKTCRELAYLEWRRGNFESALEHISQSLNIAYSLNNKHLVGELMIRTATVQNDLGKQEEAIEQLKRAIPVLESIEDYINIARAYNNIGMMMKYQDRLDDALVFYHKSLEASEHTESPRSSAYPMANAAECYAKKGELDKATEMAKKAGQIFVNLGEKFMLARLKVINALIADGTGDIENAEKLLDEGLAMYRELNIPNDLARELYETALLYKKWGRPEASKFFEESVKIYESLGNETLAEKVRRMAGK